MIYQLRHLTTYHYGRPVTFARCALRLTPRTGPDQKVTHSLLAVTPRPTRMEHHIGQFGEKVVSATIETPHRELTILSQSRVEVTRPPLLRPLVGQPWEEVRESAFADASLDLESPANFLYPTPMTAIQPAITDYAAQVFTPGRPILEAAFALASQIKTQFHYDPDSTDVSTPAIDAFNARSGVCQDFAHIMISGLHGLGLPAAYVSGYLRTIPPAGKPRLEGADATHAWVSLWCGRALGWVGFDPTNALVVAEDHIILAIGRDYADVAPIGGIVIGAGEQVIDVAVDVIPQNEMA